MCTILKDCIVVPVWSQGLLEGFAVSADDGVCVTDVIYQCRELGLLLSRNPVFVVIEHFDNTSQWDELLDSGKRLS